MEADIKAEDIDMLDYEDPDISGQAAEQSGQGTSVSVRAPGLELAGRKFFVGCFPLVRQRPCALAS